MLSISWRDFGMPIPMHNKGIPSIPSILELSLSPTRYQRCFPWSHNGRRKIKLARVVMVITITTMVMPCSRVLSSFIQLMSSNASYVSFIVYQDISAFSFCFKCWGLLSKPLSFHCQCEYIDSMLYLKYVEFLVVSIFFQLVSCHTCYK